MDFSTLCHHTNDGLDIEFNTAADLAWHMHSFHMTLAYLYPFAYPREEDIVWTEKTNHTSLYNQLFLTSSKSSRYEV
jgi:hypothetical protein